MWETLVIGEKGDIYSPCSTFFDGKCQEVGEAGHGQHNEIGFRHDEVLVLMNHPIGGRQQTLSHELWADHWLLTSHLVPTILTGTDY